MDKIFYSSQGEESLSNSNSKFRSYNKQLIHLSAWQKTSQQNQKITNWKKIFVILIIYKGLISVLLKEFLHVDKTNNSIKKNGQRIWQMDHKKENTYGLRHGCRCWTLHIREMKIKTILKYHFLFIALAKFHVGQSIRLTRLKKWSFHLLLVGMKNDITQTTFIKSEYILWMSNPTSENLSER